VVLAQWIWQAVFRSRSRAVDTADRDELPSGWRLVTSKAI